MRKILKYFAIYIFIGNWLLVIIGNYSKAVAIYDPLSVANNRLGVHILDPQELLEASKLINSSDGDWGYVTVPIRSDDRDTFKWTTFFKRAGELHVIPIVRLATYVDGDKWVTPSAYDLVDFANFLAKMPWPTENRYIVIFNEPNHAKEWGGRVNPAEYAALLVQSNAIFKSRSQDFFIISAGLDMSAPQNHTSMDALEYYKAMSRAVPDWGTQVDGFSFHAYPNPGFLASFNSTSRFGPTSYRYELATLKKLGIAPKAWFITETGTLRQDSFYANVLANIWTEPNIVAITPFLLFAGTGDFTGFSLLNLNHQPTPNYIELFDFPKTKGSPLLNIETLAGLGHIAELPQVATNISPQTTNNLLDSLKALFYRPEPTIKIGDQTLTVEIADTDALRIQGLSGRDSLPANHGMLFVFPQISKQAFWMKDMQFALDMIWIRNNQVVEISHNVYPPHLTGNTPIKVYPVELVDSILEVTGGFAIANNIKVGDIVSVYR